MIILTDEQRDALAAISIFINPSIRADEKNSNTITANIFFSHILLSPQYSCGVYDIKLLYLHFEGFNTEEICEILNEDKSEKQGKDFDRIRKEIQSFYYYNFGSDEQIKEQYNKIVKPTILYAVKKLRVRMGIEHEEELITENKENPAEIKPEQKKGIDRPGTAALVMENYECLIRQVYRAVQWAEDHDSPIDGINRRSIDDHRNILNLLTKGG